MSKIVISPTLKDVFGSQKNFSGHWPDLLTFLESMDSKNVSKVINSEGVLHPFIRVAKNGEILQINLARNIVLSSNDEVTIFLAASGG